MRATSSSAFEYLRLNEINVSVFLFFFFRDFQLTMYDYDEVLFATGSSCYEFINNIIACGHLRNSEGPQDKIAHELSADVCIMMSALGPKWSYIM